MVSLPKEDRTGSGHHSLFWVGLSTINDGYLLLSLILKSFQTRKVTDRDWCRGRDRNCSGTGSEK